MTIRAGVTEIVEGVEGLAASYARLSQKVRETMPDMTREEQSRVVGALIQTRDVLAREYAATARSVERRDQKNDPARWLSPNPRPIPPPVSADNPRPVRDLLDRLELLPDAERAAFCAALIKGYFEGLVDTENEAVGVGVMLNAVGVVLVYGNGSQIRMRDALQPDHPETPYMRRVLDALNAVIAEQIDAMDEKPAATA